MSVLRQSFRLPFTLPAFNEIEALSRRNHRTHGNEYAALKATLQPAIVGYIAKARLRPVLPGVSIFFVWTERDRRRDPLDIRPACKIIVDALCERDRANDRQARAGIIHCDGWHCIRGTLDDFHVDPLRPGVEVVVTGELRAPPPRAPIVHGGVA